MHFISGAEDELGDCRELLRFFKLVINYKVVIFQPLLNVTPRPSSNVPRTSLMRARIVFQFIESVISKWWLIVIVYLLIITFLVHPTALTPRMSQIVVS